MQYDKNTALEYLNKDYYKNCNIIYSMLNEDCNLTIYYATQDGVCVYLNDYDLVLISTENEDAATRAIASLPTFDVYVANNLHDALTVNDHFGHHRLVPCYQAVYDTDKWQAIPTWLEVKLLDASYAPIVTEHYSLKFDIAWIQVLMERFGVYGAFVNGQLAGFAGSHEDGSLGLLEVFAEYTKRGVGTALVNYLLRLRHEQRKIAYSHIRIENEECMLFHQNLPCVIGKGLIYWGIREDVDKKPFDY